MSNRRQSSVLRETAGFLACLWRLRLALAVALPYLALVGWLLGGAGTVDSRPEAVLHLPETPLWSPPDREHPFGTDARGEDIFQLSRAGMATSVAAAVVAAATGLTLALLLATAAALLREGAGLAPRPLPGRGAAVLPGMALLLVFTGGSGGGLVAAMFGMAAVIAALWTPLAHSWILEQGRSPAAAAASLAGMSGVDVVLRRALPESVPRLAGAFARAVPAAVLAEMALAFTGFTGDRLSCGALVAHGREFLMEAPWLVVGPGALAAAVVLALAALGWCAGAALKTGPAPRHF